MRRGPVIKALLGQGEDVERLGEVVRNRRDAIRGVLLDQEFQ